MDDELINLREAALSLLGGRPEALNDDPPASAGPAAPPDPAALTERLRRALAALKAAAVSDDGSRVDYRALAGSPAYADYRALAAALRQLDPRRLPGRAERLAFWINLYNCLAIDAVVQLDVRGSVLGAGLAFFRRAAYDIGGLRLSLDDIEHGLLRGNAGNPLIPGPQFGPGDPRLALVVAPPDPRIHFALNCAGRSCPPIAAYAAARLDEQLDLAARSFIGATTSFDPAHARLTISPLLDWYAADFGGLEGAVRFVADHLPDDERRRGLLACAEVDLAFGAYDWALNDERRRPSSAPGAPW